MKKDKPIGIFDSGLGGLTVVAEIKKLLPNESIIYFGDAANLPYGTKSPETVIRYSIKNSEFLLDFGVKMIVVACNTASAIALPTLKERYRVPVVGVIEPSVREAIKISRNGVIGVIGTSTTIKSGMFKKGIESVNGSVKAVYQKACPLFVPIIEEGWVNHEVARIVAEEYLSELKSKKVDTLVLGCTHYPLLKHIISDIMGGDVKIVDTAYPTALEVKRILEENSLLSDNPNPYTKFFVSDITDGLQNFAERILGEKINLEKVYVGG